MQQIPPEIRKCIFSFLGVIDVVSLCKVCKSFSNESFESQTWYIVEPNMPAAAIRKLTSVRHIWLPNSIAAHRSQEATAEALNSLANVQSLRLKLDDRHKALISRLGPLLSRIHDLYISTEALALLPEGPFTNTHTLRLRISNESTKACIIGNAFPNLRSLTMPMSTAFVAPNVTPLSGIPCWNLLEEIDLMCVVPISPSLNVFSWDEGQEPKVQFSYPLPLNTKKIWHSSDSCRELLNAAGYSDWTSSREDWPRYVLSQEDDRIRHLLLNSQSSPTGYTILMHCLDEEGSRRLIWTLIDAGADPTIHDTENVSLLYHATYKAPKVAHRLVKYLQDNHRDYLLRELKSHNSPLFAAIASGNIKLLSDYFAAGASPVVQSPKYGSLLCSALHSEAPNCSEEHRLKLFKTILENGAPLDSRDSHLRSTLHLVLRYPSILSFLLDSHFKQDLPCNLVDVHGRLPIHEAATASISLPTFEMLWNRIKDTVNVNVQTKLGRTPLMESILSGAHDARIKALLEHPKIDLSVKAADGSTVLSLAAKRAARCEVNVFEQLINFVESPAAPQIDLSAKDERGFSLLASYLSLHNNQGVVKLDIVKKIVTLSKQRGCFPEMTSFPTLREALLADHQLAIIEYLLSEGVDPNGSLTIDARDSPPLLDVCYGCRSMDTEKTVELLLKYGADPNRGSHDGTKPIHAALGTKVIDYGQYNRSNIVKMLVGAGADVNATTKASLSPLLMLTISNINNKSSIDLVATLLSHGADVNLRGPSGWTALCCAAANPDFCYTSMLLDHGADFNIETDDGATPLSIAILRGNTELALSLLEKLQGKTFPRHCTAPQGTTSSLCMDFSMVLGTFNGFSHPEQQVAYPLHIAVPAAYATVFGEEVSSNGILLSGGPSFGEICDDSDDDVTNHTRFFGFSLPS